MALTQDQQIQNLIEKQLEDEKHLEDTLKVKQAELLNVKTEISILTKEYTKMMNRIAGKMASDEFESYFGALTRGEKRPLNALSLGQPVKKKQ